MHSEATVTLDVPSDALPAGQSLLERIVAIIPTNPTDVILNRSMFQIVVLAIFLAVALVSIKPARARPIMELVASLQEISMKVVSWAMAIAPIAVFGLLAQVCVQIGLEALVGMSIYVGTVLLGLLALLTFYAAIVGLVAHRSVRPAHPASVS